MAENNPVALNNRMNLVIRNRMIINGGARVIVRNGVVMPMPIGAPVAAKAVHDGPEQIDQVLPVSDRILLTTTTGRVVALERSTGGAR